MSSEQFGGVLRAVLAFVAGFVPATMMDGGTSSAIVGGLVTIGVAVWSWYTNKNKPAA